MILLYHLVFPDSTPKDAWNAGLIIRLSEFKKQLLWIKKRFEIVTLETFVDQFQQNNRMVDKKYAITFDDGYSQVLDLVMPFLIEENIPATFFTTTHSLNERKLLWFVYINALCSERCYESIDINETQYSLTTYKSSMVAWRKLISSARASGDPIAFSKRISNIYPLPERVVSKYAGISKCQLKKLGQSEFLGVGAHTINHPYLDQISQDDCLSEILGNKRTLEEIIMKKVKYFAYTGGEYNLDVLNSVQKTGFEAAFAIKPRDLGENILFEMPRIDIYSPSLLKFKLKAHYLSNFV